MTDQTKLHLHGKPIEGFEEVHEHISPLKSYMAVFGALLVLTGLTYAVSYMSLGPASLPVAMIVALAKATLVCMYFMHLKYDDRYHVFVFLSTLIFVGIFFTFTIFDLQSRDKLSEEQGTFFMKEYDREPPPPPVVIPHGEGHGEGEHGEGDHGESKAGEGKADKMGEH
ncbi:MAG: cytochrome C oxidase subunit IV family protein [Myxococcota bacterium]